MTKRTILIPIDGSPNSLKAVEWANNEFLRPTDLVVLCHVYYLGFQPNSRQLERVDTYKELEAHAVQAGKEFLHQAASKINIVDMKETLVLEGEPKEVIEDTIEKYQVDAVVMGSRGFGPVKRILLGSVSSHITQHCHVPVFVIKEV
jgi:nucleotide-binding universal stress UspA family protein